MEGTPAGVVPDASWVWSLRGDDVEWLADLALARGAEHGWLWSRLLLIADEPGVPPTARDAARMLARGQRSDLVEARDEQRRRSEELQRKYEEEEREILRKQGTETHALADLVSETLAHPGMTLKQRMHRLSWLVLVEPDVRPTNVKGRWEDLLASQQEAALAMCERALLECEATPIPDENSYPMGIAYEAACFSSIVLGERDRYALDAAQIRRWLPACIVLPRENADAVIKRCAEVDASATEDVVIAEVHRDLRIDAIGGHVVEHFPRELRSPRLLARIADLVRDDRLKLTPRIRLLATLTSDAVHLALPLLLDWLSTDRGEPMVDRTHRAAAIELLLVIDPQVAWPALKKAVTAEGPAALLRIHTLTGSRSGLQADLEQWPTSLLEDLAELLHETFPADGDRPWEEGVVRSVTHEDEYRRLRGHVPYLLFNRGRPDDVAALDRLAARRPQIGEWLAYRRAESAAGDLLQKRSSRRTWRCGRGRSPWTKLRDCSMTVYTG